VSDLEHHAERLVDQRPEVVHDRLIELAERLRDETPPIEAGTQAATLLGVTGPLEIAIVDRGPDQVELRTTNGRIRGEASATLAPTADGRTTLAIRVAIKPLGFAANLMLGVALRTMPGVERQVVEGLERGLDDLARELAKPDAEWDAASWRPTGLPTGP
jgi:hypothetical protein